MNTTRKLAISAVATLGLFLFGAAANAGHPGSGREMGHGPVVNSSGKIGKVPSKFDKEHKEWEYKVWNRYTCRYEYCYPTCSQPVEAYTPVCDVPVESQSVCEVPVCPETVVVPTTYYEGSCSYAFRKPCYDSWHHESNKPTTASSHRNSENLGGSGSKPTTASSHRNTQNLGNVASFTAGSHGRK
jgi:hypothetical protein